MSQIFTTIPFRFSYLYTIWQVHECRAVSLKKGSGQRLRENIGATCTIFASPDSSKSRSKCHLTSMCLLRPELRGFSAIALAPSMSSSISISYV